MKTRSTAARPRDGFTFEALEPRQMLTIVVNTPFNDVSVTRGGTASLINLSNHFIDDWVTSVVRFATNSGNLDIALFGGAAPVTVANFLNYVTNGTYNNTIFHREQVQATQGIGILQGGGFQVPAGTYNTFPPNAASTPQPVTVGAPIALEHPTGNVRGTIAMARTASINSATSQFFFNNTNNSAILDDPTPGTPDAGYAVFGQLLAPSLQVLDALTAFQDTDFSSDFGGNFNDLPLHKAPNNQGFVDFPIAPTDYLQITSAAVLPDFTVDAVTNNIFRTIEVTSSNNAIATASVVGGNLLVTPSATNIGTVTITIRITGLDGTLVTTDFDYTVSNAVPTAGGMQGQSNVAVGGSLLLSTYGVADSDTTTGVASVAFFHDTNDNGVLDDADTLMGTDTSAADGWNARIDTTGLTAGANRFFARATDADGGTAVVTRIVTLRPEVPAGTITPDPASGLPGEGVTITIGDLPDAAGIRRVSLFIDTNGDGLLDPLSDHLVGHATYDAGAGNWAFTVDGGSLAEGTNRIFARTTDNYGNLGGVTSAVINVGVP